MNEEEAIDNFKFFNEGDYITKEMVESKDIVLHLIKKQQEEIHELKEKLQMFIPRRRVRRIYKMIGKILRVDVDPIVLEKELKAEENQKMF